SLIVKNVPPHLQIKEKLSGKTVVSCKLCREETPLSKMRSHVGKHILFNMRNEKETVDLLEPIGALPCGFCGRDSTCQTQFSIKKGGGVSISSTCSYHYKKMQYKAAQETTKTSPCTNVPIHCQLCPPMEILG
ncbi:hypothetical protein B0H34DRAFT_624722, partial [Crassisporium funariophilum]